MGTILRSVRHALRVLARASGFSLTAIATLALGIGAATAMFTIVNSVLLQGMWLACIGVALGVAAALAGARVLRGLLFGVGPSDPASYGLAIAVLGAAAFLACYGPALRAARIDPMAALRAE